MSIRYQCACGQNVVLPNGAAGRKARCLSCRKVFSVPSPAEDTGIHGFHGFPALEPEILAHHPDAAIAVPRSGFIAELVESFLFLLNPRSLATFAALLVSILVVDAMPPIGFIGFVLSIILTLYICAFYMNVVLETAAGEDDLPAVWVHSVIDDLIVPTLHFVASWVLAMGPLIVTYAVAYAQGHELSEAVYVGLTALAVALWPILILAIAVGRSLGAARPDLLLRTIIATPLPYLCVLAATGVSAAIYIIPEVMPRRPAGFAHAVALHVALTAIRLYAAIVALRAVGLYYRHFKHRFPWSAE